MIPDLSKKRVIVHNLTLKGIEHVPGVLDFDQRGVLFARPGDTVVTKRPVEKAFLDYLSGLGWNFSGVHFLSPRRISGYTYRSIFTDASVVRGLKVQRPVYIDSYQNTSEEGAFSRRLHMPLYATPSVGQRYGTKSGFRKLAKRLGLPIVPGFESVRGVHALHKACVRLFTEDASSVVIKIDEGVSGAGQTILHKKDFLSHSRKEQMSLLADAIGKIPQLYKESAVTVEQWREDIVASPSIQLEVTPRKEIRILSLHDQLLEGKEKWYIGCSYPQTTLTAKQKKKVEAQARVFTRALMARGFIGFLGLDTIITKKREILWVEANIRKPGTFYPRIIAQIVNGGTLAGMHYVACDFTVNAWKGKSFSFVARSLKNFLYPLKHTKEGVVVYNTGALMDAGRFDVVCIGRSKEEATQIFGKIKKHIDRIKEK